MKLYSQLPSFDAATAWLNRRSPISVETKGRPTLVHFWSLNSETAKTNLAHVAELRDQRKREGLRVIAVHLPSFEGEMDKETVRDAAARLNLTEPCALDNNLKLRDEFLSGVASVPAYYLFDIEGQLRGVSTDALGLQILENQLEQMFADLRGKHPFCLECEMFLNKDALFCSDCGLPLTLPGSSGTHPYYDDLYAASLPTIRFSDPDPLIGRVIGGKYELTARLGEGGMSVVYRANRIHIGDEVAVKVLLEKFVSDDDALQRFRREARAAAMLRHPNVITIHDFGETGDTHAPAFIVMEFVRGTPMREVLKNEHHFAPARAVRLMRAICAGVGSAHRQGVVHRDLKPENILIVAPDDEYEFETVRVVDFGLAKVLVDRTAVHTGSIAGTPHYMSPEQCLGEPLDARSDVYSLGAMFYEMLSGVQPFVSDRVSGIIRQHLCELPPPLPPSLSIPRRIAAAITHALAKDPNDRPQTANELGRHLQIV